jgi:PKD domain
MRHGFLAVLFSVVLALTAACSGDDDPPATNGGASTLPVANAGAARTVARGSTVTLDGSGSRDPAGAALSYAWTLQSRPTGSTAALSSATVASPSFVPDLVGAYTFALVVSNASVSSAAATVVITAFTTNAAPSARAGGAQSVLAGATVQLDGSGSTDPDGDALTYTWSLILQPTGSTAVLSSTSSPQPTFLADQVGTYTANLVVSDGVNPGVSSLVVITAAQGNVAPVARAGVDRAAVPGSTVTLDGSASSDANADPLSFSWTLSSKPAGSQAVLANANAGVSTLVPDLVGSYVATLVVRDGVLDSAPSTVTITVSTANLAPVAQAGAAQTVLVGSRVTLNGSGSSDPNGDPLTHQWSLTSRPAGSAAVLTVRDNPVIDFVADVPGLYVASLVVSDGRLDSPGATVTITAVVIPALLPGAGTFAQAPAALPFVQVNGSTGAASAQAASCAVHSAVDLAPDGVALATSAQQATVSQVDLAAGRCKLLFNVAEPMAAIAVAADGVVHLLSEASTGGARQIYRYAPGGTLLSKQAVSGSSTVAGVANLSAPQAMDFAPDGALYVSQQGAVWQLDAATGVGTFRAGGVNTSGDFDIDSAGLLRSIIAGQLNVYRISDWGLDRSLPVQGGGLGGGPLVHR